MLKKSSSTSKNLTFYFWAACFFLNIRYIKNSLCVGYVVLTDRRWCINVDQGF